MPFAELRYVQCVTWLRHHGLAEEEHPCNRHGCTGTMRLGTRTRHRSIVHQGAPPVTRQLFRCSRCRRESGAYGRWCSGYRNPERPVATAYMLMEGYNSRQISRQYGVTNRLATPEATRNLGRVAEMYLGELFVSFVGKCEFVQCNEAYHGKQKQNVGRLLAGCWRWSLHWIAARFRESN